MKERGKVLIGIDEAGLGPVWGPMIVAGVKLKSVSLEKLLSLGTRDSKLFRRSSTQTSREKREAVLTQIKPFFLSWRVEEIRAEEIDRANIFFLEVRRIARILKYLQWEEAHQVYIGALGMLSRQNFLKALQTEGLPVGNLDKKLIYEMKAERYPPVGAASIAAKVARDKAMERICRDLKIPYISGYATQNTARVLKQYFTQTGKLPPCLRLSRRWEPLQNLLRKFRRS